MASALQSASASSSATGAGSGSIPNRGKGPTSASRFLTCSRPDGSSKNMNDRRVKILLIEDNPGDRRLIQETLAESGRDGFELSCSTTLLDGLDRIKHAP